MTIRVEVKIVKNETKRNLTRVSATTVCVYDSFGRFSHAEQRGSTTRVRSDRVHHAGRRERRNTAVHRTRTGDRFGRRADRHESHASQRDRQRRDVPEQPG